MMLRSFGLLSALAALTVLTGCPDQGIQATNASPEAIISSHSEGDVVLEGETVSFWGIVSDPDHQTGELLASWSLGGQEICAAAAPGDDGTTSCQADIGVDDSTLILEVVDPKGAADAAIVNLTVTPTDAPTVAISSPEPGGVYYADQLITFEGLVSDGEDDPDQLVASWESSLEGELSVSSEPDSSGAVIGTGYLGEGEHGITLRAEDSSGKTGTDSVVITVGPANSPPSCEITAPESGAAGAEGALVSFEALVDDADVPADWLEVVWTSDKDGEIGQSTPSSAGAVGFPYSDLSVNTHVVSMTVTDEVGATCTDFIYYTVGTPPSVTLTAPSGGEVYNEGQTITFSAQVSDNEDSPNTLTLSWDSDLDGTISTQGADSSGFAQFNTNSLSTGEHTVILTVTDSAGFYGTASVGVTVNALPTAPTVSISPDPATSDDDLVATASGSTDPDSSGTVTYSYQWYEAGMLSSASASAVFPAASTTRGLAYRVVVTPNDGTGDGTPGEAEITISNSDPVVATPVISPSSASVGETIGCSATATDPDGDATSIVYQWDNATTGASLGSGGSLVLSSGSVSTGDTIACTATATDSYGGAGSASSSITVGNSDPVIDSIAISPSSGVTTSSTLSCAASASDPDGGSPTLSYTWSKGATSLGSGSTLTLSASTAAPGDTITCAATATDSDGGTAFDIASVLVENTAPVLASVSISPSSGVSTSSTLSCAASASDADGGSPTLSYAWSNGGTSLGSGSTLTLSPSISAPGDSITCTATATDADGGSDSDSASVTVGNTPPVIGGVTISPSSGVTSTSTVSCSASATDADGGTPSISYAWTNGSTSLGSGASLTLSTSTASGGDTITCTATATDADGGSDSGSASVTVDSTAPSISSVSISPDPAFAGDTLACSYSGFHDPDGDPDRSTYAWTIDGVAAGTTATLSAGFYRGDVVQCTVTPSDGSDTGTPVSDSLTISNTPPVLDDVTLTPSPAYEGDTFSCTPGTVADLDGDAVTYSYAWDVEGVDPGVTTATLGSAYFDRDEAVTCTVTPNDGYDPGTPVLSNTIAVSNSAPSISAVSISPTSPAPTDTLTCSYSGYSDADGDADASTYAWTVGGVSAGSGSTLASGFGGGDVVACTVTPHDGTDAGTAVSASVTIGNTPPVVDSVSLSPSTAYTDTTITAVVSTSDAEGDTVTVSYAWTVSGTPVSATGSTLSGATWFDKGDVIAVIVTPNDGMDDGTAVTSGTVTVANTPPTAPTVSIAPSAPLEGVDDLVCQVDTASSDDDGDSVSYSVTWTQDGASYTGASTTTHSGDTVSGSATTSGEVWACTVTPNDGDDDGSSASASVTVASDSCPVYADPTVVPGGDGSASDPYPSIAYAMYYRGSCTQIMLLPGTYDEQVDYGSDDLQISSTAGAASTILQSSIGGTVVTIDGGQTAAASLSGVTITGGTNSGLRLYNASPTISDCIIDDNSGSSGGGIYAYAFHGSLTDLTVSNNTATSHGGGAYLYGSDPTITNVSFGSNTASGNGGGAYLNSADPTITDGAYSGNASAGYGGGLYLYSSYAEIFESTFTSNTAYEGGGLWIQSSSPVVEANWIDGNNASRSGGYGGGVTLSSSSAEFLNNVLVDNAYVGLYIYGSDASIVLNNTIVRSGWYALYTYDTPSTTLINNIFYDSGGSLEVYARSSGVASTWTFENNNAYDGSDTSLYAGVSEQTGSNDNISQDPRFTDETGDDFSLVWGSLCIDHGQDVSAYITTDYYEDIRPQGLAWDIGAFELAGPTDDCDGIDDGEQCAKACPVYVDATVEPGGNGDASDPFPNIGYAQAYGVGCTEIVLLPGTYDEQVDYGSDDLQISSTAGAASTILQSSIGGTVVTIDGGQTAAASLSGVTITGGTNSGLRLYNASPTISDCIIDDNSGSSGGGIYAYAFHGSLTDLTVSNNTATSHGGGAYLYGSDPTITNVSFGSNTASGNGGGAYLNSADPTITDGAYSGNASAGYGGGLYLYSSYAEIFESTFTSNTAYEGGGLWIQSSSPVVEANWIDGNNASRSGGYGGGVTLSSSSAEFLNNVLVDNAYVGLYIYGSDASIVLNNTIVRSGWYALYTYDTPSTTLINNIFYDSGGSLEVYARSSGVASTWTFENNNAYDGSDTSLYAGVSEQTGSNDNISQDPRFTDETGDDFSLVWGSLCIDHGQDVSAYITTDYYGTSRPQGLGWDLGAIESY